MSASPRVRAFARFRPVWFRSAVRRSYAGPARRLRSYASASRHFIRFARTMPAMRAPAVSPVGVVADAMRFVGAGNVTGMPGAWCADYASMILRRTGHRPLAGRSVAAALSYGPHVRQPKPGDLVIVNTRAGYAQHVGFFAGWSGGQMQMVSGNWGHRVRLSPISPGTVAAFVGL